MHYPFTNNAHYYHIDCINNWHKYSKKCPLCYFKDKYTKGHYEVRLIEKYIIDIDRSIKIISN